MKVLQRTTLAGLSLALVLLIASNSSAQELTTNGGFETGDTTGWQDLTVPSQSFLVGGDVNSGSFAGEVFNNVLASAAIVKQANIGIGTVSPGDKIEISFAAKGDFLAGGVGIAEFFSEVDGGGTSASEILGGAPFLLASEANYQTFSFTTTAGPDVTGGVTLQFVAGTGGAPGSFALLKIDDVSVRRVPEPTTALLLCFSGMGLLARRRR